MADRTSPLANDILDQLRRLRPDQLRGVLEFTRTLAEQRPAGVPGKELLRFAGTIDAEDLSAMAKAIEEGCEKADLNDW
jgi:hypothetical protein